MSLTLKIDWDAVVKAVGVAMYAEATAQMLAAPGQVSAEDSRKRVVLAARRAAGCLSPEETMPEGPESIDLSGAAENVLTDIEAFPHKCVEEAWLGPAVDVALVTHKADTEVHEELRVMVKKFGYYCSVTDLLNFAKRD